MNKSGVLNMWEENGCPFCVGPNVLGNDVWQLGWYE